MQSEHISGLHRGVRARIRRQFRALIASLMIGALSLPALAGPTVAHMLPRGGRRGTDVAVEFTGSGLEKPLDVMFHGAGMTVRKLDASDATHVKCIIGIAPDAPIGLQAIRLRTASGVSNLKLFSVGNLAELG